MPGAVMRLPTRGRSGAGRLSPPPEHERRLFQLVATGLVMPLSLPPARIPLYERNKAYAVPASVAGETYETRLTPRLEQRFRTWAQANRKRLREYNPDDPTYDYDMRGWWRENVLPTRVMSSNMSMMGDNVHFTDKYKKPWHTSFSRESIYANPDAPQWIKQGNNWLLVDRDGQILVKE